MIKIHLSELLKEQHMTQAELAKNTGIRPSTISAICNEVVDRLNVHHLNCICKCLDCNLTELLEYLPDDHLATFQNEFFNNRIA